MELTSYCKVLRAVGSYINLRGHGTRLSGSTAARIAEDNTVARSEPIDSAPAVQCGSEENCFSRPEPNRMILVKTSSSLIHVEKNLLPLYVLNFYLEDAILKRFSDHNKMSTTWKTHLKNTLQETCLASQYSSTTTAVEFKEMTKQTIKTEKSTPPLHVSRTITNTNVDNDVKNNGGILPFITKLPTFRQKSAPPQAGFASTTEKTSDKLSSHDIKTTPVIQAPITSKLGRGITDAKGNPAVEGSVHDGSFSPVTRVNIFEQDPTNSIGLGAKVTGKGTVGKKDADVDAATIKATQEFLKYQTVTPTEAVPAPVAHWRAEAEVKTSALVTQMGSLRDAHVTLFSKSRHAPRTLMSLKESVDTQYNDQRTVMLLKKYKLLKLREIDYHHAQIKKHRKVLLELMFKTPYQKTENPSKPP